MYQLIGRKTGIVRFSKTTGTITQETLTKTSKMTSNAIENGSSIEDHVYLNPEQLQIGGVVTKNHSSYRSMLDAMWKNRDLVTYVGKIRVTDYVITNLQIKNVSSNKRGFQFTATLQKANIVSGQYVEMGRELLMSEQDAQETSGSIKKESAVSVQTSEKKSAGLQTTVSQKISQSAYAAYVDSYGGKSSSGPSQRSAASYNGI